MGAMGTDIRFTQHLKCGHCQNTAPMQIATEYSGVKAHSDGRMTWDAGSVYELIVCPACREVMLRSYFYHDMMDPEDITYESLYPSQTRAIFGLPKRVEKAYLAAVKVRQIDANAYGVLIGRLLDIVCEDRGAKGQTLDKKLKHLATSGEIPKKLVDVAAGLRQLRNIGAHANLGELTERELPVLDDLIRAILDYVYSAPYLASVAAERLAKLKRPAATKGLNTETALGAEQSEAASE